MVVECEYIPELRPRTWSPTCRVTAVNDGDKQVTVAANDFTLSGETYDYDHFAAGDKVLFVRGGYTTGEARTIATVSGTTITLTVALGLADTDDIYMIFNDYSSAQTSQKTSQYAWQTGTDGGVSTVEGGRWL